MNGLIISAISSSKYENMQRARTMQHEREETRKEWDTSQYFHLYYCRIMVLVCGVNTLKGYEPVSRYCLILSQPSSIVFLLIITMLKHINIIGYSCSTKNTPPICVWDPWSKWSQNLKWIPSMIYDHTHFLCNTLSGLPGQANQSNFFSFQTIYSKKTKKPRIKEARGKPGSFHQDNSTTNGPLIQLSWHLGNYNSHNASVALFSLLTENKVRGREAHKGRLYLSHKI